MIRRGRPVNVATMNTHIHFDIGSSTLGQVLVATNEKGICAILLGHSAPTVTRELRQRFPEARLEQDTARLARVLPKVLAFADGRSASLDLPLDPAGTEFQQRVWRALRGIPTGQTASYVDIARRIDAPKSFRAVAQACGANPIALAIPCHRVVRNDGALSGYRWGVARKRALLEREAAR
jgi:AraC family transcriptional regulator, regulatory protein of adaptative response / methylated-DNA-[protein]-cysteine methyltransferase